MRHKTIYLLMALMLIPAATALPAILNSLVTRSWFNVLVFFTIFMATTYIGFSTIFAQGEGDQRAVPQQFRGAVIAMSVAVSLGLAVGMVYVLGASLLNFWPVAIVIATILSFVFFNWLLGLTGMNNVVRTILALILAVIAFIFLASMLSRANVTSSFDVMFDRFIPFGGSSSSGTWFGGGGVKSAVNSPSAGTTGGGTPSSGIIKGTSTDPQTATVEDDDAGYAWLGYGALPLLLILGFLLYRRHRRAPGPHAAPPLAEHVPRFEMIEHDLLDPIRQLIHEISIELHHTDSAYHPSDQFMQAWEAVPKRNVSLPAYEQLAVRYQREIENAMVHVRNINHSQRDLTRRVAQYIERIASLLDQAEHYFTQHYVQEIITKVPHAEARIKINDTEPHMQLLDAIEDIRDELARIETSVTELQPHIEHINRSSEASRSAIHSIMLTRTDYAEKVARMNDFRSHARILREHTERKQPIADRLREIAERLSSRYDHVIEYLRNCEEYRLQVTAEQVDDQINIVIRDPLFNDLQDMFARSVAVVFESNGTLIPLPRGPPYTLTGHQTTLHFPAAGINTYFRIDTAVQVHVEPIHTIGRGSSANVENRHDVGGPTPRTPGAPPGGRGAPRGGPTPGRGTPPDGPGGGAPPGGPGGAARTPIPPQFQLPPHLDPDDGPNGGLPPGGAAYPQQPSQPNEPNNNDPDDGPNDGGPPPAGAAALLHPEPDQPNEPNNNNPNGGTPPPADALVYPQQEPPAKKNVFGFKPTVPKPVNKPKPAVPVNKGDNATVPLPDQGTPATGPITFSIEKGSVDNYWFNVATDHKKTHTGKIIELIAARDNCEETILIDGHFVDVDRSSVTIIQARTFINFEETANQKENMIFLDQNTQYEIRVGDIIVMCGGVDPADALLAVRNIIKHRPSDLAAFWKVLAHILKTKELLIAEVQEHPISGLKVLHADNLLDVEFTDDHHHGNDHYMLRIGKTEPFVYIALPKNEDDPIEAYVNYTNQGALRRINWNITSDIIRDMYFDGNTCTYKVDLDGYMLRKIAEKKAEEYKLTNQEKNWMGANLPAYYNEDVKPSPQLVKKMQNLQWKEIISDQSELLTEKFETIISMGIAIYKGTPGVGGRTKPLKWPRKQ